MSTSQSRWEEIEVFLHDVEWVDRQIHGPGRVVAAWRIVEPYLNGQVDGSGLQRHLWELEPEHMLAMYAKHKEFNRWFAMDLFALESNGALAIVDGNRLFFDDAFLLAIPHGPEVPLSQDRQADVQSANEILTAIYLAWETSPDRPVFMPVENKCCKPDPNSPGCMICDTKRYADCVLLTNCTCQVPPSQNCQFGD